MDNRIFQELAVDTVMLYLNRTLPVEIDEALDLQLGQELTECLQEAGLLITEEEDEEEGPAYYKAALADVPASLKKKKSVSKGPKTPRTSYDDDDSPSSGVVLKGSLDHLASDQTKQTVPRPTDHLRAHDMFAKVAQDKETGVSSGHKMFMDKVSTYSKHARKLSDAVKGPGDRDGNMRAHQAHTSASDIAERAALELEKAGHKNHAKAFAHLSKYHLNKSSEHFNPANSMSHHFIKTAMKEAHSATQQANAAAPESKEAYRLHKIARETNRALVMKLKDAGHHKHAEKYQGIVDAHHKVVEAGIPAATQRYKAAKKAQADKKHEKLLKVVKASKGETDIEA